MAIEGDDRLQVGVVSTTGTAAGTSSAQATVLTRVSYAYSHLTSAKRFWENLVRLEAEHAGKGWGSHWEEARDYAVAAIVLSFSAIEASVNEALDDLNISGDLYNIIERAATIEAAQATLLHLGKPIMERGAEPVQSANLLRELRNALVHARGEWSNVEGTAKKLSKKIVSAGLPLSPFAPNPRWAFEQGMMSAGMAQWAVTSARSFIMEFREMAGLPQLPL